MIFTCKRPCKDKRYRCTPLEAQGYCFATLPSGSESPLSQVCPVSACSYERQREGLAEEKVQGRKPGAGATLQPVILYYLPVTFLSWVVFLVELREYCKKTKCLLCGAILVLVFPWAAQQDFRNVC